MVDTYDIQFLDDEYIEEVYERSTSIKYLIIGFVSLALPLELLTGSVFMVTILFLVFFIFLFIIVNRSKDGEIILTNKRLILKKNSSTRELISQDDDIQIRSCKCFMPFKKKIQIVDLDFSKSTSRINYYDTYVVSNNLYNCLRNNYVISDSSDGVVEVKDDYLSSNPIGEVNLGNSLSQDKMSFYHSIIFIIFGIFQYYFIPIYQAVFYTSIVLCAIYLINKPLGLKYSLVVGDSQFIISKLNWDDSYKHIETIPCSEIIEIEEENAIGGLLDGNKIRYDTEMWGEEETPIFTSGDTEEIKELWVVSRI